MSKVQLQGNVSGTGVFTIASPNSNTDRTLTLPDNTGTVVTTGSTGGVSQAMLASGVAGNGPAFRATLGSNISLTQNVITLIPFDTEVFDINNRYNPTSGTVGGIPAYSFLPNVAGYYYIHMTLGFAGGGGPVTGPFTLTAYLNGGAAFQLARSAVVSDFPFTNGSIIVYLNGTTDSISMYAVQNATASATIQGGAQFAVFEATLIRAA